jgi:hypothetical protein
MYVQVVSKRTRYMAVNRSPISRGLSPKHISGQFIVVVLLLVALHGMHAL